MSKIYKKVPTSVVVWAAITERHAKELFVFSSYTAMDGDSFGNPSQSVTITEYGFKDLNCPFVGIRTTWDVSDKSYPRETEKNEYWLCVPLEQN